MSGRNRTKNSEREPQKTTGPFSAPHPHRVEGASPEAGILVMQHNAGNQAVNELLESDADRRPRAVANAPHIAHEVLRSPGQPLDPATRAIMETRFGYDFSHVRVHTDAKAAESARKMDARAYTVGRDVVFSEGYYIPHSHEGSKLLAHELAHVIQQGRGGAPHSPLRAGALERHADAAASAFAQGQPVQVHGASSPGLARQPLPGARESRPKLRELLKLDPRNPKDQQLGAELDNIEALLKIDDVALGDRYPWGDELILKKAMELNKNTGGKMGGAVLAYYDRLVSGAVGGMLAQATTPVVKMTDPSGRVEALITAAQVAQAHKKLQMDTALGLIQGFATAGAVAVAGGLAVGLLMIAAVAAPAVFGAYAGASAMTADAALALTLRLTPRLMAWAARNPYLAEAVVTAVVGTALDFADTGSVDPMQVVFNFLHIQQTRLQTGTPTRVTTPPEAPPTTTPKATPPKVTTPITTPNVTEPTVTKLPTGGKPPKQTMAVKETLPEGFEDIFDQPGITTRRTPGGAKAPDRATAGTFAHKNLEKLEGLLKGHFEEFIPPEKLRPGLTPEYEIPIPEYKVKPRIDRLDWDNAEVIEIKPDTPYWRKQGLIEAEQYAEWMNKYQRRTDGKLWKPRVVHYDLGSVIKFLKKIGFLE